MNRKTFIRFVVGAGLLGLGAAGRVDPHAPWFLFSGAALVVNAAIRLTYYRSGRAWEADRADPRPLRVTPLGYLKALLCWFDAFERTYAVEPGLYYTGSRYDRDTPLLVTSNYFLTVFLVARRARAFSARLLVVDTDGINVWCSAGKGAFGNDAVLAQVGRYDRDLLTDRKWLRMVFPKLAFAGVVLPSLLEHHIRPVIGPVYARDLPAYLAHPPLRDCTEDEVTFGLQMRVFSWLPGLVQYLGYSLTMALLAVAAERLWGVPAPFGIVVIAAAVATAYPILFPWIPGKRFAVKGLWIGACASLALAGMAAAGLLAAATAAAALFSFAAALFFGLSYTGNSAVSNYSAVRKEVARFLPLNALLFAASLVVYFVGGQS